MLHHVTLHDVFGRHQAIYSNKKERWVIQFCSWLRPRAVHVLRARDEVINSLRSAPRASLRSEGLLQSVIFKMKTYGEWYMLYINLY